MSALPLDVRGLSKFYGQHRVLEELQLQVQAGEVVALRGPNGSGKSTLLGCCSGGVIPDAGELLITGVDLRRQPLEARRHMRVLPQQSELPPGLTGRELLAFWAEVFAATPADRTEAEALGELGEALDRLASTYSVGMQRRLHFGAMAMGRAALFMLDEPFAGVDGAGRERLCKWLQAQAQAGVGILLAAHDADANELRALGAREYRVGSDTAAAPDGDADG